MLCLSKAVLGLSVTFGNIRVHYIVRIKVGKNESVDWDFLSQQSSQSIGLDSLL